MMNWGRKKTSSSSSSHSHLISHVFPLSWLSKFKRKSENSSSKHPKTNKIETKPQNLQRVNSVKSLMNSIPPYYWDSKLYTQDNDGFWRLSSNKETIKETTTKKKKIQKVKVSKTPTLPEKGTASKSAGKIESPQKTYRRIMEATEELHRELNVVNGYRKSVEKELSDFEIFQVMQIIGKADENGAISRNYGNFFHQEIKDDDDKKLKDAKIKEVLLKNEKQRKSFHVGRGSSKIRVNSPKTPSKMEPCKIQAAKMKKKMKEFQLEDKDTCLGSFAVVKSSKNPQQHFRDSMVEMIMEKRITSSEELEELLACYLTLNSDEYHDIIIKVFRQVWHELEEVV